MLDSNFSDYFVFAINFRLFAFLVYLGITEFLGFGLSQTC